MDGENRRIHGYVTLLIVSEIVIVLAYLTKARAVNNDKTTDGCAVY